MKNFKHKHSFYVLMLIMIAMFIGGYQSCQAQEKKQYPQNIILEMELEQVVKFKIPKNLETPKNIEELNKQKQSYPPKGNAVNLKRKCIIPEVDVIKKEADYENNK